MYNNYNPAQARIDSLMQQRQMIDQQIQQVQQYANIPPININNQITPQQQGNFDFNGKWVNDEQEARNFANANLPTILFDNNKSIFYTMIHGCVDSDEEKTMIKTHIRDMFNMYQ